MSPLRDFSPFFLLPPPCVRYTIWWNAGPWQRSSVDYAIVTICADDKRLQNEKRKIRKISETKRKTTGSIKYSCTTRCRRHVPRRDLRRTWDVLNPSSCAPGRKQFIKRDFKLMYVREKKGNSNETTWIDSVARAHSCVETPSVLLGLRFGEGKNLFHN